MSSRAGLPGGLLDEVVEHYVNSVFEVGEKYLNSASIALHDIEERSTEESFRRVAELISPQGSL